MAFSSYAGIAAKKTQKRKAFIDGLVHGIEHARDLKGLSKSISEKDFAHGMERDLRDALADCLLAENPGKDSAWAKSEAEDLLFWERRTDVTVNNTVLFATQHRPDMYIKNKNGYRVAIEFKLAADGSSIRDALGQCLVYASEYEFTIAVLLDNTADAKIKRAFDKGELEKTLLEKLWDQFGIKVVVVERR